MSVEGVMSRMAAIEARFGLAAGPAPAAAPVATSPSSFDRLLQSELTPPALRTTESTQFESLFTAAGTAHGVDPALLSAVAQAESGMDPNAVSHAGAQGLMQLMPGTARGLGVTDPFDPAQAVDGAARLLRGHLDRFGSVELALAAYNAGAGAVSRHGGIPPYPETQAYVRRVLDLYGAAS